MTNNTDTSQVIDTSTYSHNYFLNKMAHWQYANQTPACEGVIKQQAADFQVIEIMHVTPKGEGEHIWLYISKTQQNTEQVAKNLARFANVAYRDVGYSGMKDFHAVTEQWFSVWLPKSQGPDWSGFEMEGVSIKQIHRHDRKIKRGTHQANQFTIRVRYLTGDIAQLEQRLESVKAHGVPNYFGEQRFGRQANNLVKACAMLCDSPVNQSKDETADKSANKSVSARKKVDRHARGIYLSAIRSFLFNEVLSARIVEQNWQSLYHNEPANLNGSGSCFKAEQPETLHDRLASLDIHPTAPLWGESSVADGVSDYMQLAEFESTVLSDYSEVLRGLEKARVRYQRRPIRMQVNDLNWIIDEDSLALSFNLQRGQFATSVIRELIAIP